MADGTRPSRPGPSQISSDTVHERNTQSSGQRQLPSGKPTRYRVGVADVVPSKNGGFLRRRKQSLYDHVALPYRLVPHQVLSVYH